MVSIFLRSLVYNVLFYLVLAFWVIVGIPTYLMPRRAIMTIAKYWARSSIWLLRVICNVKVEYRGLEKIPDGPLIVAANTSRRGKPSRCCSSSISRFIFSSAS
jgi:1-acyl-sn-glycerol-3-phosphate acyltransferase